MSGFSETLSDYETIDESSLCIILKHNMIYGMHSCGMYICLCDVPYQDNEIKRVFSKGGIALKSPEYGCGWCERIEDVCPHLSEMKGGSEKNDIVFILPEDIDEMQECKHNPDRVIQMI